jgi:hypothetical protein
MENSIPLLIVSLVFILWMLILFFPLSKTGSRSQKESFRNAVMARQFLQSIHRSEPAFVLKRSLSLLPELPEFT